MSVTGQTPVARERCRELRSQASRRQCPTAVSFSSTPRNHRIGQHAIGKIESAPTEDAKTMNLHPYDGVERRFSESDPDQARSLLVLRQILLLDATVPMRPLRYDLSLYSGGIGVVDQLAATLEFDSDLWQLLVRRFVGRSPGTLARDPDQGDWFLWLLTGEEDEVSDIPKVAAEFVNSERAEFQRPCTPDSELVFQNHSDVNGWVALWISGGEINFLGYNQG